MILRFRRRKPGENFAFAEKQNEVDMITMPKKGKEKKITEKVFEKVGGVDPSSRQDEIDPFTEREELLAREDPILKKKKSIVEQKESINEDFSRKRKRKKPKERQTEKGEGGTSKRPKKVKEKKNSKKVHEKEAIPTEQVVALDVEVMDPGQGAYLTQNMKYVGASSRAPSSKKKGRGPATVAYITENTNGVRKVVEFNTKGQPIGPVAAKFSTYLGVLGRKMVPISHERWHKVSKELKEELWICVESDYEVDPKRKKNVISAIGERWRTFKKNLTRKYIFPFKDQPEFLRRPPERYSFIEQKHWDAFVRSRLSEEFQNLSKTQAEKRAKSIYNHRLSRKGYAGLVEELRQVLGRSVDDLDRCDLWKMARQNKDGVYVNDAVKEKVDVIDELTKKIKEGSIITQGKDDVLTLALGTPESSGRVRGVGRVSPMTYFHLPRRGSTKYVGELEEMQKVLKSTVQENQEKIKKQADKILEMNHMVQELQAQFSGILPQESSTTPSFEKISSNNKNEYREHFSTPSVESESRGSQDKRKCPNDDQLLHIMSKINCQSKDKENPKYDMPPLDSNSISGKSKQCRLAVGSKTNIVARGLVFERVEPNEKIHNVPLGESNLRVAIEYAISSNVLLPVPVTGEMTMVKDAIGSCVAWPKEFVLTGFEEEEKLADGENSGPIQAFANFINQTMSTDNIIVPMQDVIFEQEIEYAHLDKADLMYLCNMQELTASCIITYIRYLYDKSTSSRERYGFVNPASISSARGPDASAIITKRLQIAKKDQLFFVPYNMGAHWILMVIDSSSMDVYWLDPLQKPPCIGIKIYVNTGIKGLQVDGIKRPNPTWHNVKCSKQPTNVECGYYIMRYMRELMEESSQPIAEKMLQFSEPNSYSQDEIDEVRLELIDFILTNM